MSETNLRAIVKRHLSPIGIVRRIENRVDVGTPDAVYVLGHRGTHATGFFEYKYLRAWPKKPATPVRIRSLTKGQVMWMESWSRAGGRVHLLLKVGGRVYALLTPSVTRQLYEGKLTVVDLIARASVYSVKGFPTRELLEALVVP